MNGRGSNYRAESIRQQLRAELRVHGEFRALDPDDLQKQCLQLAAQNRHPDLPKLGAAL